MIDTHSHIYEPDFADDLPLVVQRAQDADVERVLLPNINEQSIQPMLDLCRTYPTYVRPMMGLHPEDVREDYHSVLSRMQALLDQPHAPYIAIGEIGIDLYWDSTYATQQEEAFEIQLQWAELHDLPVVIHSRAAHDKIVAAIRQHPTLRGIFHCFGGTIDEARELLAFEGFMLGIGGVLTFKKSTLPEVLREAVPLNRIVLETDAPYLAPVPNRGKRNEPSFLPHVAQRLSAIYDVSPTEIDKQTTLNVQQVFHDLNKN